MNRTVLYVGGAAVVGFILWKKGLLPGMFGPNGGSGTNGGSGGGSGGVITPPITTLPGGPVINCIQAPCPGSGDIPTRGNTGPVDPNSGDAPWWTV